MNLKIKTMVSYAISFVAGGCTLLLGIVCYFLFSNITKYGYATAIENNLVIRWLEFNIMTPFFFILGILVMVYYAIKIIRDRR